MICITVMYPKLDGSSFDASRYLHGHIPLAFGLLRERFGVAPLRVEVLTDCREIGGSEGAGEYHCICNMYFRTRADAECLIALRDLDEATAAMLRESIAKFTTLVPRALICEVRSGDAAALQGSGADSPAA